MKAQQLPLGLRAQPSEAPSEALPAVLSTPPWRQPRLAPLSPLERPPALIAAPCTVLWSPGERLKHLRPARAREGMLPRLEAAMAQGVGAVWMLAELDDGVALLLWNTSPACRWSRPSTAEVLSLLARFEAAALPGLIRLAQRDLQAMTGVLARIQTPEIAPLMAQALGSRSGREIARRWLLRDPVQSAIGLIPAAIGPDNRLALRALRLLEQSGQRRTIQNSAANYGPRVSRWIGSWLARSSLLDVPSRRPKMPVFWNPSELHRPTLRDGSPLSLEALQHLGEMLCFSPVAPVYPGIKQTKRVCCPDSLDAFVIAAFSAWEAAGCPPQHDWPLWAIGHLGSDRAARHLAARIRTWPGHGGATRAASALQVLVMIGTPIARLYLHHIAETTRYAGLRSAARAALSELARTSGVSLSTLLDTGLPHLGLDAQGSCTLDFGSRQFLLTVGADLQPQIQDQRGRSLRALPRPGRRDMLCRAEQAWQRFRTLRQDVRILTTTWARRMERLMCRQHRLSAHSFHALLTHPVLSHCAAGLLWGAYTNAGERLFCFRIAEDFTLTGRQGEPILLPPNARVGLPHRLHLSADEAQEWAQTLARPPAGFRQLDRPIFTATHDESAALMLTRFAEQRAPAGRIMALLGRGWQWGEATETGFTTCHRAIPDTPYIAVLSLSPGIAHTSPGEQTLGPLRLHRAAPVRPLPLSLLSPLQFSELLGDLSGLVAASEPLAAAAQQVGGDQGLQL